MIHSVALKNTVRVVYVSICKKCEACIKESVCKLTYEDVDKAIGELDNKLFYYHDKKHDALFRRLVEDKCIAC